jgi:hypothetical protein
MPIMEELKDMISQFKNRRHELGILALFFSFFMIQILILSSGFAWVFLDPDQFSFWMLVFVAALSIVSGIVATYSFVQYTQEGSFRSFVLTLLGANVILLAFLYLLTHPVTTWSIFSDRRRNMTITAALGFLITPGVLGSSLVGHKTLTPRSRNVALLWGVVAQPLVSLVLLLSPEPVFILTSNGFGNLSLAGWILSIVIGVSTFLSLVRYLREWVHTRESITLASSLALILWILSFLIYLAVESPIQVAELLWLNGIAEGFVLLAVTMIITSIIEPHRVLESLVRVRTIQLEESRKDTEFYLRLWTHKIGNLLQGITTYLELIGYRAAEIPMLSGFQNHAMDLVKESTIVNRQVERLVRIKEKETSGTWPVNLSHFLSKFQEEMGEHKDAESFEIILPYIDNQIQVVADDLIDIVFSNLMTKYIKQCKENYKRPSIRINDNGSSIQVFFGPCSSDFALEIKDWAMNKPTLKNSIVDLDMFMVWLLMERYGGSIEYRQNQNSQDEELVLMFKKAS